VICGALRLARFNVITGATDKRYFIGLPIPAGAAVACSMVILLQGEELARWMRVGVAVVTYLVSLLMVSTFRYWSFKEFDWAKRPPVHTLLIVVLAGMIVATKHEVLLFLVFGGYAVSGPVRRLIVGHTPAATPADVPTRDHP
jgi:CDP-diacylglycerol---serine O-phosphatidyltransferase